MTHGRQKFAFGPGGRLGGFLRPTEFLLGPPALFQFGAQGRFRSDQIAENGGIGLTQGLSHQGPVDQHQRNQLQAVPQKVEDSGNVAIEGKEELAENLGGKGQKKKPQDAPIGKSLFVHQQNTREGKSGRNQVFADDFKGGQTGSRPKTGGKNFQGIDGRHQDRSDGQVASQQLAGRE